MNDAPGHFELSCRGCRWRTQLGLADLLARMRASGKLRRANDAPAELVLELAKTTAAEWTCEQCGRAGLTFRVVLDDPEMWNDARHCSACDQVIPPERVELFPDSTLCAACQRIVESGSSPVAEYCERCGSILKLRPTKSAGISRYSMYCPSCRR